MKQRVKELILKAKFENTLLQFGHFIFRGTVKQLDENSFWIPHSRTRKSKYITQWYFTMQQNQQIQSYENTGNKKAI